MAAPNIVNVSTISGKTAVQGVSTSATAIVTNSAASGKVYKVNSLLVSNVDGINTAEITIDLYRSSTAYHLIKTASITAGSTLDVLAKTIYLEEGDSIRLTGSAASDLEAVCSYEEIDSTGSGAAGIFSTLTATGNTELGDAEATDTHAIKGATTLLANTSSDALRITQTGTGNALVVEDEANPDSTPFVVSPDGKVFIGSNTSITSFFGSSPSKLAVSGVASPLVIESVGINEYGSRIDLLKTRGTTSNSKTIINNGDTLGEIYFGGTDGTSAIPAALISAKVDGTPGTNDMPGRLEFYTTADGASSPTERMRIDSSGKLWLADDFTEPSSSSDRGDITITNGTGPADLLFLDRGLAATRIGVDTNDSGNFKFVTDKEFVFRRGGTSYSAFSTGSDSMRIDSSGNVGIGTGSSISYQLQLSTDSAGKPSTNTWTIVSDERIKENIELADLDLCYDAVKNIPLKRFKWRDEVYSEEQVADRHKLGWIAQDVEAIYPKAVNIHEFKYNQVYSDVIIPAVEEELDEDGNVITEAQEERTEKELVSEDVIEDCRNLNADQIYAAMYGAIQKLIQKVETLETRIAELEA